MPNHDHEFCLHEDAFRNHDTRLVRIETNMETFKELDRAVRGHNGTPGLVADVRELKGWKKEWIWTKRLVFANFVAVLGGVITALALMAFS